MSYYTKETLYEMSAETLKIEADIAMQYIETLITSLPVDRQDHPSIVLIDVVIQIREGVKIIGVDLEIWDQFVWWGQIQEIIKERNL